MTKLIEDTKMAIELEKKGYDFYATTSEKTTNPLAKTMLKSLAERELIHQEKIVELYKSLTGEQKLKSDWLKDVEVPPSKKELVLAIVEKLKINLNQKFETKEEISKAYLIAEGLETDSFTLYDRIAKENSDPIIKKFYTALADEEREHYAILDETIEYLDNPGDCAGTGAAR